MAKEAKQITSTVRMGQTVYRAGQEDDLAKVLTKDDVARLTEKGIISGFGATVKTEAPAEETADATADEAKGSKKK